MKRKIKLSESELNRVIKESVKNVLNEISYGLARRTYKAMRDSGQRNRAEDFAINYGTHYKTPNTIPDVSVDKLHMKGDNGWNTYDRTNDVNNLTPYQRTEDPKVAREYAKAYNNYMGYKPGDEKYVHHNRFRR